MSVSDIIRQASVRQGARELTPAQKGVIKVIETRLGLVERYVKEARTYLDKWQQGPKFDPQKDNLKASLKAISAAGKSTMFAVDKL